MTVPFLRSDRAAYEKGETQSIYSDFFASS